MKSKLIAILILLAVAGCTSKTDFGPCVGIGDDQNPKLVYKVNAWNVIVGVFFFSLIAPPVLVVVDQLYCPVGVK